MDEREALHKLAAEVFAEFYELQAMVEKTTGKKIVLAIGQPSHILFPVKKNEYCLLKDCITKLPIKRKKRLRK